MCSSNPQPDLCWGSSRPTRETNPEDRAKFSRKIHLLWLKGGRLICVIKLSDSGVKVVSIWTRACIYLSPALSGTGLFKRASPSLWGSPDHQCLETLTASSGRRRSDRVKRVSEEGFPQLWGKHSSNRSSFRWLHTSRQTPQSFLIIPHWLSSTTSSESDSQI